MITKGTVEPAGLRASQTLIQRGVCRSVTYHDQAASTSSLALKDSQQSVSCQQLPRLYLTDRQTAGRGRHGRSWHSNHNTLTFSILMDWPSDWQQQSKLLSLGVGVGVARTIEFLFAPLRTRLKWPNDVYIGGGKVAGILMEASRTNVQDFQETGRTNVQDFQETGRTNVQDFQENGQTNVVIGVGVNVGEAPEVAMPGSPPARSIAEVTGRATDRYELLEPLVTEIIAALDCLSQNEQDILTEFRQRCLLTGNQVQFRQGTHIRQGLCQGITDEGQLQIQTDTGQHQLESGEATLLRVQS